MVLLPLRKDCNRQNYGEVRMKSGAPIEIRPVSNGFLVQEVRYESSTGEILVFTSLADLSEWLFIHFLEEPK